MPHILRLSWQDGKNGDGNGRPQGASWQRHHLAVDRGLPERRARVLGGLPRRERPRAQAREPRLSLEALRIVRDTRGGELRARLAKRLLVAESPHLDGEALQARG